ncbi:MAG: 1,4-dihydroxy-2-naphthoate polyprenyltransferase [Microscillaceae bacterium]|jgi:1,4-dihydroxy-2-naphthoate octaprenyltransferase|nr:1,4-dihydroxy-2-naphthoate polyprenyltransferase [Microscillaceae bacterium]
MKANYITPWLTAFRLRTLPLALAGIGMGSFLAASFGAFRWQVLVLCALTAIFLQILSNLANDYGDFVHGADSATRQGPSRMVQSGQISPAAMRRAITWLVVLSLASGLGLLFWAIDSWQSFWFFLGLGVLSIVAAITYTAGSRPYGYMGLGDISVFIFFGLVAVLGTFYLHSRQFQVWLLLPAASCGLFATAVLNINNIRDIDSDREAGKLSIPVRWGRKRAVWYHIGLLVLGVVCALVYVWGNYSHWLQFLFLITVPLFWRNAQAIATHTEAQAIDPYLKQMALSTLLFVISFGLGNLW